VDVNDRGGREMINKFKFWMAKKQFCPDLKDLENGELIKLVNKLKGDSNTETLTNILEWQDKNILFWWERWPFDLSLKIIGLISWMLILIIVSPFLQLLYPSNFVIIYAFLFVFVTIFIFTSLFSNILISIFYLFSFFPIIYLLISVALRIPLLAQNILPYTLFYVGCLGAIVIILVYLIIRYREFIKEKSGKEKIYKFFELVKDTFRLSLPVNKILEYRLAICKDYAKFTASLLFNMYPITNVYFVTIPSHVAVGVKIGDNYYVFDQHLPILTIDRWLINCNKKKADIYISKVLRDSSGKPISVDFSNHEKIVIKENLEALKINNEKLTEEVANILGIRQSSHKDKPNFEILLKNYAFYYEDDEIIKYSLIRSIRNRLENELCSNINKIIRIKLSQIEKDLNIEVWL